MGWLLGGDGWPAGQLPPATGRPSRAPATRRASAPDQSCVGGLLVSFGDALGGHLLAQPGMLVVHVPLPCRAFAVLTNLAERRLLVSSGWRWSMGSQALVVA
jgi:hypothetical protein